MSRSRRRITSRRRAAARAEWLEPRAMLTAAVVISELMASNTATLADHDGQFSDWIELRNTTAAPVNLGGWYLTDDPTLLAKWQLPATSLPAGGHLVVFASGKNRSTAGSQLHTNFQLSAAGEYLALVQPGGTVVASELAPAFPPQFDDVSYGYSSGLNLLGYFTTPTPGALNSADPIGDPTRNLVIDEIMYHPASGNDAEEYIELYNRGLVPVNLGGWKLDSGAQFSFPNVSLAVGQYLAVAADLAAFQAKYPGVANVVGGWTGRLSDGGELLALADAAGKTIDKVQYADEGDWARRVSGVSDLGHTGWDWRAEHDGMGRSLELRSALLSNNDGQNWGPSSASEGTPGAANSIASADVAPLILDVTHAPAIPRSTDPVTITARLRDELATGLSAVLHWRLDGAGEFTATAMLDDGAQGDGLAGDAIYGATIDPQLDGTVIEFYVSASDTAGHPRTWPTPAFSNDGLTNLGQAANALYQVDDASAANVWTPGARPLYLLVMTAAERSELADIGDFFGGDSDSNAQMNGTFVSVDGLGTQIRYQVGLRNSGHAALPGEPNNYRVIIPRDRPWKGTTELRLSHRAAHAQLLGSVVYRLAGLVAGDASAVEVRVNSIEPNSQFTTYVTVESPGADFAARHFADDGDGNVYRGVRVSGSPEEADLRYEGADPVAYRDTYLKETNQQQDDWSDLIHMTDVLNNAPDPTYLQDVAQAIDVGQWLRYLALDSLLLNLESSLNTGRGDDFGLYRGVADPRFVLFPVDLDTIFNQGDSTRSTDYSIFASVGGAGADSVDGLMRFLHHPDVLPLYYQALLELIDTVFNRATLDPLIDQALGPFVAAENVSAIKQFITDRTAGVLAQIPRSLTVESSLPNSAGYPMTDGSGFLLIGTADPSIVRSVLVAGHPAAWNPQTGQWSLVVPGGAEQPLIGAGSTWRFLDDGSNQGSAWTANDFNDGSWALGAAQLGYGDGDEITPVGFGDNPVNKHVTTYFRRSFQVADRTQIAGLSLDLLVDDGAVVYLNGHEVLRDNLPAAGSIGYQSLAIVNRTDSTTPAENQFTAHSIDSQWLVDGSNVLAVEVHQVAPSNADLSFDAALVGLPPTILSPGVNRVLVEGFDGPSGTGNVAQTGTLDVWYDDGSVQDIAGTIASDTIWTAAAGPYRLTSSTTVSPGATLTIGPGTSVYLDAGAALVVQGGLVAEGTAHAPIRFTHMPGTNGVSGGIQFIGSMQDNRISHAVIEWGGDDSNGGLIGLDGSNLTIEHSTLDHAERRRIRSQNSSLVARNNLFTDVFAANAAPTTSDLAEHIWGGGVPARGQWIVEGNTFGLLKGDNDAIDFNAGTRGVDPVPQILNNAFLGGGEDALELEGDTHVEGNLIANFVKDQWNTSAGYASAIVAGGVNREHFVARNVFKNVESVASVKQNAFLRFCNNTIIDAAAGSISLAPPDDPIPDRGGVFEGNIFYNSPSPLSGMTAATQLTVNYNIISADQAGLGVGNLSGDPRLADPAKPDVTLLAGSPAQGSGPNGLDMGAGVSAGASIAGEPPSETSQTAATLTVGGPTMLAYKFRLDGGPWSGETPVAAPIALANLPNGTHYVEAIGKNDAGVWQAEADATRSKTWTMSAALVRLLINEVLANNVLAFNNAGTRPDAIELFNAGAAAINLSGMSVSDQASNPVKYVFAAGTTLAPGQYVVLLADEPSAAPGVHLGFSLDGDGEGVFLYNAPAAGGGLIDSVEFGMQIADLSIGRVGQDRHWALAQPTIGAANVEQPTGKRAALRINEWFTAGDVRLESDFVELANLDSLPVSLAGVYLTDDPVAQPTRQQIESLSFIPASGFVRLAADENGGGAARRLDFQLSAELGSIGLFDAAARPLDTVIYFQQTIDYSQGRNPDGADALGFFRLPTPALGNAQASNPLPLALVDSLRVTEIMYHPAGDAATEFVELQNIGAAPLDLTGVRLSGGIQFTFPGMMLDPGKRVVVVEDVSAFRAAYGTTVNEAGQYVGSLSNSGDNLVLALAAPFEAAILRFDYEDQWYPTTDGGGPALVIRDASAASGTWDDAASWQPGTAVGGSPGRADADPPPLLLTVDSLTTTDSTPALTGTVNYPGVAVFVNVGGSVYAATNHGNGAWSLADNVISPPLIAGVYDVVVSADDGLGNVGTDTTGGELTIEVPVVATIVGRRVFYNNSSWDGNNSGASPLDDAAIATDKTALLAGQPASLANYTSFSKGLNGLMIDVQDLRGTPTAADFAFKTGNANATSTWTPLAVAPSVSVRPGAGAEGSTRLTLIWPDGAIAKRWLQTTVLATAATGLATSDVFYFGNAIGEAGNSSTEAQVNAADELAARGNPRNVASPAPITFRFDYNRDKQVNAADQLISRGNSTNLASALRLIVPAAAAQPAVGAGLAAASLLGIADGDDFGGAVDPLGRRPRVRL